MAKSLRIFLSFMTVGPGLGAMKTAFIPHKQYFNCIIRYVLSGILLKKSMYATRVCDIEVTVFAVGFTDRGV